MNDIEKALLEALEQVLDLTDESDWNMVHATVRDYVAEGKLSKDGEQAYKVMVEKKLMDQMEAEEKMEKEWTDGLTVWTSKHINLAGFTNKKQLIMLAEKSGFIRKNDIPNLGEKSIEELNRWLGLEYVPERIRKAIKLLEKNGYSVVKDKNGLDEMERGVARLARRREARRDRARGRNNRGEEA